MYFEAWLWRYWHPVPSLRPRRVLAGNVYSSADSEPDLETLIHWSSRFKKTGNTTTTTTTTTTKQVVRITFEALRWIQ